MASISLESLTERLDLCDQLLFGRHRMLAPQDLPGRYGRIIKAIDHVLESVACESVVAGGWAVWFHGFEGRMTQDVDIVLAADRIEEFLRVAAVAGFEVIAQKPGRWPKIRHKETGIKVDILPEGAQPGTPARLAPTTIPHPSKLGAAGTKLRYIELAPLIELKLAAGRPQDEADVAKLVLENPDTVTAIRQHLASVHADYVTAFDQLVERARDQDDE